MYRGASKKRMNEQKKRGKHTKSYYHHNLLGKADFWRVAFKISKSKKYGAKNAAENACPDYFVGNRLIAEPWRKMPCLSQVTGIRIFSFFKFI